MNQMEAMLCKIAKKDLLSNRLRNLLLIFAIFLTTFMLAAVLSLCVNQLEMQLLFSQQYPGTTDRKIEPIIYVLAVMAVLFMAAGFLLIYNVLSVSISREIRFYGLLRTIGMSAKQIRKIIFKQLLWLCAIGIPVGLLFSALVSLKAVPLFLSMYTQASPIDYPISFHPAIYIGAALFSFLTALAGGIKPARKAAQISAIEAIRFSDCKYTKTCWKPHFHSVTSTPKPAAFYLVKMAWRNVFRVPRRTLLVFFSLFLGMTMFMAVSVILGSTSVEMFSQTASANIKSDIYLRNQKADQYSFGSYENLNVFDADFMKHLNALPGLTELRQGYIHKISMDVTDSQGETKNLPGYVYSVDEKGIRELSKELGQTLDEAAFLRGDFVIARDILRDPQPYTDSISFTPEGSQKAVSFPCGGVLPAEFLDYFGQSYNWLPCVYMSDTLLQTLSGEPAIYDIQIDIAREKQNQALSSIREIMGNQENIIFQSRIEIRQEAEHIVSILTVLGNSISAILWFIGILNYINLISTGILSRRHEFALLESVGQSKGQSIKTLLYEGMIYASFPLLLVGIFGSILIYGLFWSMKQQYDYMIFRFPWISLIIMIVAIFAICLSIPGILYNDISKATLTERLRVAE